MPEVIRLAIRHASRTALAVAVLPALLVISTALAAGTAGANPSRTMVTSCGGVNLRAGASTGAVVRTRLAASVTVTVAATVTGTRWSASCAGRSVSGSTWYRISAVNGRSATSAFGTPYVYGAAGLFKAAPTPTKSTPGLTALADRVTFYGRGFGHGVGMSQYGARGRALAGQHTATILAHYYRGTTLGTITNRQIRVLILRGFAATATRPLTVYGRGGTWKIDGIARVFPADARLRAIPTAAGSSTWRVVVNAASGKVLRDAPATGAVVVRPASSSTVLQLWSKPSSFDRYRGVLRISFGATASVVNTLPLETYLRGVVPAEMPAGWPTAALRSQAIAARSYAAVRIRPGVGTFDVYDDTRSQVYKGSIHENPATNAAIAATAGRILRSGTAIVNAMYHSTGGGATEDNNAAFVSSTGARVAGAVPYLRGSPDRAPNGAAYDAASPFFAWTTRTYTRQQLSAIFAADARTNVGTLVALDLRNRGVSGRLISVTLVGSTGTTRTVSGDVFRAVFNANKPAADPGFYSNLVDVAPIR